MPRLTTEAGADARVRLPGVATSALSCAALPLPAQANLPYVLDVVGEGGPAGPGLLPVCAFQTAAAQPVAAFQMRDPAFGTGAVAAEPPVRPFRAWGGAPGDVDALGRERGKRLGARFRLEAAVEGDLPRRES